MVSICSVNLSGEDEGCQDFFPIWERYNFTCMLAKKVAAQGLCIKVGRGQGDGDIGTRVWGLGTWGRETRDLRTSSMGRGDVWDGDAGTSNTGTQGTRDVNNYCKSRR